MPFDATPLPIRAQVLIKALDLLRERGWCQHRVGTSDGRLCMFGAIREAGRLIGDRAFIVGAGFDCLGIPWPAGFNDAEGRTFAEVEQWFLDQISEATR